MKKQYLTIDELRAHLKLEARAIRSLLHNIFNEKNVFNKSTQKKEKLSNFITLPDKSVHQMVVMHIPDIGYPEYRVALDTDYVINKYILEKFITTYTPQTPPPPGEKMAKPAQLTYLLQTKDIVSVIKCDGRVMRKRLLDTIYENTIIDTLSQKAIHLKNTITLPNNTLHTLVVFAKGGNGKIIPHLQLTPDDIESAYIIQSFAQMHQLSLRSAPCLKRSPYMLSSFELKEYFKAPANAIRMQLINAYNQDNDKNNFIYLENGQKHPLVVKAQNTSGCPTLYLNLINDAVVNKKIITSFSAMSNLNLRDCIDNLLSQNLPAPITRANAFQTPVCQIHREKA